MYQYRTVTLLLVLITCLVYWQVGNHEFVNFDTNVYVIENPHVRSGLNGENLVWAFTETYKSNWHPLTWISHMLDVQLFGLDAGYHHLVNLFLHVVNTLLLFYLIRILTKALWSSALVASLFAIHPLHVESVAWVAERKDVLSGFFWMLTLISYYRYTRQPSVKRYLPLFLFLALGLMAKPMLVTLPLVMLLLDYWPLGRFGAMSCGRTGLIRPAPVALLWEKAPLLLLVVISSVVTLFAQWEWGSVASVETIPIMSRVVNALVAYLSYLEKAFWPAKLAVFYPLANLSVWQVVGSTLLLLAISLLAWRFAKSRPWLMVGWLWYLATLVPVIGLVQVGQQAMADRYTYLPLIGIFIIIAWSLAELAASRPRLKPWLVTGTLGVLLALAVTARAQVGHWRNSISLFEQTLAVTENNPLGNYNLAMSLSEVGRLTEAEAYFAEAVRLNPSSALYYYGWGINFQALGDTAEAELCYQEALRLDVELYYSPGIQVNLGVMAAQIGDFDSSAAYFQEALRLDPKFSYAIFGLGNLMLNQDRLAEAFGYFSEALRVDPENFHALGGLGNVKLAEGRYSEALRYFSVALRLAPEDTYIRERIELIRQKMAE